MQFHSPSFEQAVPELYSPPEPGFESVPFPGVGLETAEVAAGGVCVIGVTDGGSEMAAWEVGTAALCEFWPADLVMKTPPGIEAVV